MRKGCLDKVKGTSDTEISRLVFIGVSDFEVQNLRKIVRNGNLVGCCGQIGITQFC